jgi:Tfp pilus assembly protein PilX
MRPLRQIRLCVRARARDERGIALVMALGILVVLGISGTTMFVYSSQNATSARHDGQQASASAVAEAGLRAAYSTLNYPSNNALNANLLPACTGTTDCRRIDVATGYALYGGTLDSRTGTWTLVSTGYVRNGDTAAQSTSTGLTKHRIRASVTIEPTTTQPLNNPAWNYIYATHPATPGVCDEIIQQSVQIASPLFVNGNLCFQNTATMTSGSLNVKGSLTLTQKQNGVGTSSNPISDAHIGGGCKYQNNAQHTPCQGAVDNVYARTLDTTPAAVTPPIVYWDSWYLNASPGPYFPCTTSSGPVPTFDNDQGSTPDASKRNNSVATAFNLTPSTSYTCQTVGGELSWNATTRLLTVSGTIFIDGSAYIQNGAVNSYNGQAALYLSGTFLMKNSKLCAGLNNAGTDCDTANWDPNHELLAIIANGSGGQVNSWDSEQIVSSTYQGALYATKSIDTDTTSSVDGPLCGDAVNLGQSATTSFPTITVVPVGMPSNPTVYAQPEQLIYLDG